MMITLDQLGDRLADAYGVGNTGNLIRRYKIGNPDASKQPEADSMARFQYSAYANLKTKNCATLQRNDYQSFVVLQSKFSVLYVQFTCILIIVQYFYRVYQSSIDANILTDQLKRRGLYDKV